MLKEKLNEKTINVNTRDSADKTPLYYAVEHEHIDCIKALLAVKDIDVNTIDSRGDTPLSVAENSHHRYKQLICNLLKEHGAR